MPSLEQLPSNKRFVAIALKVWKNHVILGAAATSRGTLVVIFMTNSTINSNDRFVRWQSVLREHLTFLNNLILTFSVGATGFILSLLQNERFTPTACQKIFFTAGVIFTFISLALGFATAFSRLHDFRATVRKIRNDLKKDYTEHDYLKKMIDIYKKTTWALFYIQIGTFCISGFSFTISFLMIYSDKLF